MKARFLLWRQLSTEWATENPVLLKDEPGVEEDTGFWKFGDGVTPWNDLPYSSAGGSGSNGLSAYQVAVANGFVGTQSQWLDSLQGEDGTDGADGSDGTNGSDGADGADSTVPGPAGPSAYDVAVANGFVGSESAWLASLEGPEGDPGADSTVPGPPGADSTVPGPPGPPTNARFIDETIPGWSSIILDDGELGYTQAFGGILYVGDGVHEIQFLPDARDFLSTTTVNSLINGLINDASSSTNKTWSASKISDEIAASNGAPVIVRSISIEGGV